MRKVLPFTQPLAYGYQYYAFPLGILANHPKATDWVLSNYLQVVYDTRTAAPVPFAFYVYDYAESPWFEIIRINRGWCAAQDKGIAGIVRDAISSDFYVYLTLNERFVPERPKYGTDIDFPHDTLIRGVDDESATFELYGYDQKMQFRGTQLAQADLATAYWNTGPGPFYEVPVTMYRYDDAGEYTFDRAFLAQGIVEYLDSFNTSKHYQAHRDPWDRVYGMATYDLLAAHLDEYGAGATRFDVRRLQVLWEHKRVMAARLTRCADLVPEVGDLIPPYQRVERQAWMLRGMMMAHHAGRYTGDFRTAAVAVLDGIRTAERDILEKFAAYLSAAYV